MRGALEEIRACHGEFDHFFSEIFQQLDSWSSEFGRRVGQWQSQRQQEEDELSQQAQRLQQTRDELTAQQERLDQTLQENREQAVSEAAVSTGAIDEQLRGLLEEAGRQRSEIHQAQESVHEQLTQLSTLASTLAESQTVAAEGANTQVAGSQYWEQLLHEFEQQKDQLRGVQEAAEAQTAKLDVAVAELTEARTLLAQGAGSGTVDEGQTRELFGEFQQHKDQLQSIQEAAAAQIETLTAAVSELGALQGALAKDHGKAGPRGKELDSLLKELQQQRDEIQGIRQISEQQTEVISAALKQHQTESSAPRGEIEENLQQLEQQHAQLEQERRMLELELESVRNRAAEMSESLTQQKREMTRQQADWSKELKHMRRAIEGISEGMVEGSLPPSASGPAPAKRPDEAPPAADDADPVLDSVMAQFEMLQKDLAKRRAHAT